MNPTTPQTNASPATTGQTAKPGHTFLPLIQQMPFASCPPFVELKDERILCNDVRLAHEHSMTAWGLWVIGNVYGAVAAVWAECEQDALDEMIDAGLGNSFLVPEDDVASATDDDRQEWAHLGNAGEPCDLSDAWIGKVALAKLDVQTMCRFAEARGGCLDNLGKL